MNEFVSWCRHLLVSFLFHALTSLHPPSFHKNDFSTCSTHFSFILKMFSLRSAHVDFMHAHAHAENLQREGKRPSLTHQLQRDHPHLRHCEDPRDPTPRSHPPHPWRPLHTTAHSDSIPTWSVLHRRHLHMSRDHLQIYPRGGCCILLLLRSSCRL